ncbi:hypothetical protein ANN_03173 [Periplaneta americana]|uniref:Uncharacterized protein n=1 Tax=Periplaneta americana TaxID=6978 RepID=A0ABQ8TZH7_PERAM|nr:hypothetical protein ANN_03173 [Periplaneta americana]
MVGLCEGGIKPPGSLKPFVLKAIDHDHPPLLEELEAIRCCIRLQRAAENEPDAGPGKLSNLSWRMCHQECSRPFL